MSVKVMSAVFDHSRSTGSSRLVLLALADVAHESGMLTEYPRSYSMLAKKTNLNERTVGRAIFDLECLGELEVVKQGDGRKSADYRIMLPGLPSVEGGQSAYPASATRLPRVGNVPTQGGQPAHPIIPSLSVVTPSSERRVAKRRTQLPDDFELNEIRTAKAVLAGVPPERVTAEFEKFRAHHESKASSMANWDAAWRYWVGNYRGPRDGRVEGGGLDPSVVRALAEAGGP